MAVYKYPSLRKRQERHQLHVAARERSLERDSSGPFSPTSETHGLLVDGNYSPGHSQQSSLHTRVGSGGAEALIDEFELVELRREAVMRSSRARDRRARQMAASESSQTTLGGDGSPRERKRAKRADVSRPITIPSPEMGLDLRHFIDA